MPVHDLDSWMWAEACEMMERADRLHRQFFKPAVIHSSRPLWEPPLDIYETAGEFKIIIALPGVALEQVKIIQDGNRLIVGGQRQLPANAELEIRRLEIPYGCFERSIEIPAGSVEVAGHEFVNGCLVITLKKM